MNLEEIGTAKLKGNEGERGDALQGLASTKGNSQHAGVENRA